MQYSMVVRAMAIEDEVDVVRCDGDVDPLEGIGCSTTHVTLFDQRNEMTLS
jgi:hypothetical protein